VILLIIYTQNVYTNCECIVNLNFTHESHFVNDLHRYLLA